MPGCKTRQQVPICSEHIRKLSPQMQDRLMKAFREMKAGRRDSLQKFNNTLSAAQTHIAEAECNAPPAPRSAQGSLL